MKPGVRSFILVIFQLLLIVGLIITTPVQFPGLGALIWMFAGAFIALWALVSMHMTTFSPFPEPRQRARLVTTGPYRYIRHPMYTGVLLFCGGLLIVHFTMIRLIMYLLLFIVLVIKLQFEEKLLLKKYKKYEAYIRKTGRLIPGVY